MTLPTLDEPEEKHPPRKNDGLILYKLDELKSNIGDMQTKMDAHIKKTDYMIHGNGSPGLKTSIEVIKTRMTVMWGGLSIALVAIVNDYFKSS